MVNISTRVKIQDDKICPNISRKSHLKGQNISKALNAMKKIIRFNGSIYDLETFLRNLIDLIPIRAPARTSIKRITSLWLTGQTEYSNTLSLQYRSSELLLYTSIWIQMHRCAFGMCNNCNAPAEARKSFIPIVPSLLFITIWNKQIFKTKNVNESERKITWRPRSVCLIKLNVRPRRIRTRESLLTIAAACCAHRTFYERTIKPHEKSRIIVGCI